MWPFRYFGQYTVAEDTLDPDDLIFPRAATRVGSKFQGGPLWPTPGEEDAARATGAIEERGEDDTIEVLSLVCQMSPKEVETMETYRPGLTRHEKLRSNVDWYTEVIKRFTDAWLNGRDMSTVNMKSPMHQQKWKRSETRWMDKDWTDREVAAFEDAIAIHGAELGPVRDEVGSRTMPEVVRFYGHWKNSKLGEENAKIKAARAAGKKIPAVPASPISDDEGSIITEAPRGGYNCGACRTRESDTWWKAPKGLPSPVLCDNCGMSWRKYADLNVRPLREETLSKKSGEKREGTPLANSTNKRARGNTNATQASTSSPPPPSIPQFRCLACHKNGPATKVLRCRKCQFRVHPGAVGVTADASTFENWTCELCANEKNLEASLIPDCLLCPRIRRDPKKKALYPPPDTYLRACKPTEGQAWVHILCAVFIPEITFSDASRLRLVEGVSTIPQYRWMNKCTLCDSSGGAVVRCSDCPAEYHVSCAWKAGHKFGFELQHVKSSKRDSTVIVDFKDSSGCMVPQVTCKGHPVHRRQTYGLCETNSEGETALQVYVKNYKQAITKDTHGLLRKALRLDSILNTDESDSETSQTYPNPQCSRCRTEFSPRFYPTPPTTPTDGTPRSSASDTWLCHKCHFALENGNDRTHTTVVNGVNGIAASS
ncbi:hypothetical protein NM688_g7960 [Phlebia brevispora]|uniref:Uncharacterized protein n=1 Tax=Phlebia brevispora TaxID=194682 RepID=A0ACC1RZ61_9APHY|nr:hypothetical protein NM688_g7960 [Phlebia brevispora]